MTKEEIIKKLEELIEDRESFIDDDPTCDIFRQDAEALREAVKLLSDSNQVKLDRIRWEGCEHCTAGWDYNDYRKWEEGELGEIRISKDELNIDVGPYWETVKIKFCPYCGRPLAKEAWAELERRMSGG